MAERSDGVRRHRCSDNEWKCFVIQFAKGESRLVAAQPIAERRIAKQVHAMAVGCP